LFTLSALDGRFIPVLDAERFMPLFDAERFRALDEGDVFIAVLDDERASGRSGEARGIVVSSACAVVRSVCATSERNNKNEKWGGQEPLGLVPRAARVQLSPGS